MMTFLVPAIAAVSGFGLGFSLAALHYVRKEIAAVPSTLERAHTRLDEFVAKERKVFSRS